MMNKNIYILMVMACLSTQTWAQSLTEAEVSDKMSLAFELNKEKKYSEALDAFLTVGNNTSLQRTEGERKLYVCSQTMACMCYGNLKQNKEAYLLAKNLLQGNLDAKEKADILYEYTLNGYLYACDFLKKDESGHADYQQGREILQEIEPFADGQIKAYVQSKIPLSWYFEGIQCSTSQKYNEALIAFEKALAGFHELGKTSEEISVLKEIAAVKNHIYDFTGAIRIYNQALELARKIDKTSVQMEILKAQWKLGNVVGDMDLIRSCSTSMDSLVEHSSDAKVKLEYYNQKGDEAKGKEQYQLAEEWYIKGKTIAEEYGQNTVSANKYLAYQRLRDLYATTGQYDEALHYGRKSLSEYQRLFRPNDANYYLPYSSMADIYRAKGEKDRCFACLDSLFLSTSNLEEPREQSMLYTTRARCHAAFQDYSSALADYRKADEILATKYPPSDGSRIVLMALIGGAEYHLGHYAEAEQYYKQYAEHTKILYGENSMEYINAQIYLANAEGFADHIDAGCNDYTIAANRLKDLMKERFPYMSSSERESFWNPVASVFITMTPYALKAELYQTAFTRSCYDALVMSKAFLLESERSLYEVVKKEGTEDDMRDYMMLALMKTQIKEWEKDYKQFSDSILSMSQRADRIASRLAERCHSLSSITDFMDIDHDAVKQALKQDEVLIDFTDFMSESSGRKYAAYIIEKHQENPLLTYLFEERQIDSLGVTRPDMYYNADYAPDILKLLWTPLKEHIPEGATVYYVPSQLLFQVSLESLPLADGSLLGSHYNFIRLSSARELVKDKGQRMTLHPQSAILYGGLQYDLPPTEMAEASRKYNLPELLVMRGNMVRGDSIFRYLPGSKEEIIKIDSILKANKWQVTPRMDMEGTEESFLSMHGKAPQILQIATHGFYYTPDLAEKIDYLKGYSDAMSLSGIVLSGGNAAWLGKKLPDGVLGGILTAHNIARLDLSGTEMVVLSACQSGQGKATSEGLYGLQRAFKKAGVGTMVMALWNVSDKVATDFMITFYEQLADKNNRWNKRKAFEQTKSIIRNQYPDPFHWAAFVMLD